MLRGGTLLGGERQGAVRDGFTDEVDGLVLVEAVEVGGLDVGRVAGLEEGELEARGEAVVDEGGKDGGELRDGDARLELLENPGADAMDVGASAERAELLAEGVNFLFELVGAHSAKRGFVGGLADGDGLAEADGLVGDFDEGGAFGGIGRLERETADVADEDVEEFLAGNISDTAAEGSDDVVQKVGEMLKERLTLSATLRDHLVEEVPDGVLHGMARSDLISSEEGNSVLLEGERIEGIARRDEAADGLGEEIRGRREGSTAASAIVAVFGVHDVSVLEHHQEMDAFGAKILNLGNAEEGEGDPATGGTIFKNILGSSGENAEEKIGRNNTSTLVFDVQEAEGLNELANVVG